ncbi:helix-turn-helix transcriptional regulator [Nocardioides sp. STR2]|uniref:Helix-turn-helix transcriptional regulator n=1 Tax=Nocardioides pini TaxID=2975053 RepID=A0ABT4CFM3_9ACTN|nr:helix-turn-helix transcriptional regulator [Nocardioides pini]MCY4727776.1 helix-turn-helix transcriptional regulator [Nocardioides pini]
MERVGQQDEEQQAGTAQDDAATWDCLANRSQAERDYWFMGPFDGGIPGMVRRVRRILNVSQRGLAAILKVSQSVVARWETGRTSPRACVVERLLQLARLRATVLDEDGQEVGPMRADGARTHGGSRYPAHVDLRATGWWVPRRLRAMTSVEAFACRDRSRRTGDPAVRYRLSSFWKRVERELHGTPDDHPALGQLAAEVRFLDERREARFQRPAA